MGLGGLWVFIGVPLGPFWGPPFWGLLWVLFGVSYKDICPCCATLWGCPIGLCYGATLWGCPMGLRLAVGGKREAKPHSPETPQPPHFPLYP